MKSAEPSVAKILMWIHVCWYVLVPSLGLAGLFQFDELEIGPFVFMGWIPAVILLGMTQVHYRISTNPVRAMVVVAAVPLEVAISILLLGDSFALFFVEVAFVELFSLTLALSLTMFLYRPSGLWGAFFSVIPLGIVLFGFWEAIFLSYSNQHFVWLFVLLFVIITALVEHLALVLTMASSRSLTVQKSWLNSVSEWVLGPKRETIGLELKYGNGVLIFVGLGLWVLCSIYGLSQ